MKRLLSLIAPLLALTATAQTESADYYLPKTQLHFRLLIERQSYTPGEFANFSERFIKRTAATTAATTYRIVGYTMYATATADATKQFSLPLDKKHNIFDIERDDNGVLMAVNAKRKKADIPADFVPAPKGATVNPRDYMSEEIIAAGSMLKMAELTAKEIYDIRNSRNELTRGDADYMPKDGDQLRLMLANLDQQEEILKQTFLGTTVVDTLQQEVAFCPEVGDDSDTSLRQLLFRFSKHTGLVDSDDLSGTPYYITIDDLQMIPKLQTAADGEKRKKGEPTVTVNMPGKIRVTISEGSKPVKAFETYAAQYGTLEELPASLFGKKMVTRLQLNAVNGNVESIKTEPVE